jgi:hypothetical protein
MALQLVVDNTVPLKPEETSELDAMIQEAKNNAQITHKNVEKIYDLITSGLLKENGQDYQAIIKRQKTSYPLKNAQEMMLDHYIPELKEYPSSEFDNVYTAMAFGLGDICAQRLRERGIVENIALIKGEITEYIHGGIKNIYHNPNDLIFEYDQFKEWHEEEPTELKAKTLSFFMDMLWVYSHTIKKEEHLIDIKKKLNTRCSMIKDPKLRTSIIKNNVDIIRASYE